LRLQTRAVFQNTCGDDVELCSNVQNLHDLFRNLEIFFVKKPAAKKLAGLATSSAVKLKSRKTVMLRRAK